MIEVRVTDTGITLIIDGVATEEHPFQERTLSEHIDQITGTTDW